jgi:hypothetical protein
MGFIVKPWAFIKSSQIKCAGIFQKISRFVTFLKPNSRSTAHSTRTILVCMIRSLHGVHAISHVDGYLRSDISRCSLSPLSAFMWRLSGPRVVFMWGRQYVSKCICLLFLKTNLISNWRRELNFESCYVEGILILTDSQLYLLTSNMCKVLIEAWIS